MENKGIVGIFLLFLVAILLIPNFSIAGNELTLTVNENENFEKVITISDEENSGILKGNTKISDWEDSWGTYNIEYSEELIDDKHPAKVFIKVNVNLDKTFNGEKFIIESKDGKGNKSKFEFVWKIVESEKPNPEEQVKPEEPIMPVEPEDPNYIPPWLIGGTVTATPVVPSPPGSEPAKVHKGYIVGYPEGDFRPEGKITRGEVAVIFERLFENRVSQNQKEVVFSDIKPNDWYFNAVTFMAQNNYMSGYPDGTFKPHRPITRAEIIDVLSRYKKSVSIENNNSFLIDVDEKHWAYSNLKDAVEKEWLKGYEDNSLKPDSNLTRAEAVTLINRVLNRYADEKYIIEHAALIKNFIDIENHWAYLEISASANSHEYIKENGKEIWKKIIN